MAGTEQDHAANETLARAADVEAPETNGEVAAETTAEIDELVSKLETEVTATQPSGAAEGAAAEALRPVAPVAPEPASSAASRLPASKMSSEQLNSYLGMKYGNV